MQGEFEEKTKKGKVELAVLPSTSSGRVAPAAK